MDLSPATLRARFADLAQARADILSRSTPLREERDAVSAAAQGTIAGIDAQIREYEDGLFEIDQESATIARALGGRTGSVTAD